MTKLAESKGELLIQLAPWNNELDYSYHWKWPTNDESACLNATELDGLTVKQHLVNNGVEVKVWHELPPFSEKFMERLPDLFIGIGAGDPLNLSHQGGAFSRRYMGVETEYPITWIGPCILTSWPGYAFYRVFARGRTGDVKCIWTNNPGDKVELGDRTARNSTIRNAIDATVQWMLLDSPPSASNTLIPLAKNIQTEDTFLCYNSRDSEEVNQIASALEERGISFYLDTESIRPGTQHQIVLSDALSSAKTVCIFVGSDGIGPWQSLEVQEAIAEVAASGRPTIPILLPSCPAKIKLPFGLGGLLWVDGRGDNSVIDKIVWGITGQKPE